MSWAIRVIAPALALAFGFSACKQAVPANVAASVNGRPITYADIDKEYKRQFPQQPEGVEADQVQYGKLEMLRAMIDEEILLQRAEKLSLMATESEVDTRLNQIKSPYTQEEFQKTLDAQQLTADELKAKIRRSLSIDKLWNKEILTQINITDAEVKSFYETNKNSFRFPENHYHVARIAVTTGPNPDVRNLSGNKALNEDQARKKIQMIEARLKQGEDFSRLAQSFSEDPNSAPNGGDMGYIPESSLNQVDPETRKAILTMTPGQVTAPIRLGNGYHILKLISREPAGQREFSDPRVQQDIRERLRTRKEQLLRTAYIDSCRNESKIMNYLALSLAPGFQKK